MIRPALAALVVATLTGCVTDEPAPAAAPTTVSSSSTSELVTTAATTIDAAGTTTTSTTVTSKTVISKTVISMASSTPTTSTTSPATTTSTATTSTTTISTTTISTTAISTTVTSTVPVGETAVTPIDPATVPFDTAFEIGRSVEGRPITVVRRGDPSGVRVLVVGVVHGQEAAGTGVVDRLAAVDLPPGVELWLVRSMNPDGEAVVDRQNANLVDLNRNFPVDWAPLGEPGDWQYGGAGPASEPETRAVVALGAGIGPDLVFWYHQDLYRLAPAEGRRGELRNRYAQLTGLPIVGITGGTYTGTAADWARTVLPDDGETITIELGPTLGGDEAGLHAAAVLALATEFW